jgi:cytochrome oxidase Cu insertion factor (SCO1/SenC/PrrC family)
MIVKRRKQSTAMLFLAGVALVGVACGGAAAADPPFSEGPAAVVPVEEDAGAAGNVEEVAADPAGPVSWRSATLTDVRTGETFTIDGLQGQVVMVEMMAVWCPLCVRQQEQLRSARAILEQDGIDVVTVSFDVDPGENAELLARHADSNLLDWSFVLAGPEIAADLQGEFGPEILSPPSTPVLFVWPDGSTELTPFGIKSAADLADYVRARQS